MDNSNMNDDTEAHFVSGFFGQADLFLRDQPVSARIPEAIRQLACEVIDHGGFIITHLRFTNEASPSRRMVVTAIFRRILITAEAVRVLTSRALEEPAVATLRTLLELELNLRLVVDDPTDRMARRLIYFYAIRGRRHFRKATKDARTRELFQENSEHWSWVKEMSRFFKEQLSADEFEDIREECEKDRYWHGFNSQKEAFDKAGMSQDYHTLFDSASSFVHASNVDHDVAERGEGVKGLVHMDPVPAFTRLAYMASNLTVLFGVALKATGRQVYGPTATIEGDDGTREEISAVELLQARVLSVLETVQRDFEPNGSDAVHAAVAGAFSNQAVAVLRSGHLRQALEAFSDILTRFADVRVPEIEVYIGTALLNKGYLHGKLEEPEEAIAAYDEAVRRFGDSPVPDVRLCVAKCLRNKGSMLAAVGSPDSMDSAVATWNDLIDRFGEDTRPDIQLQVASAFTKKAGVQLTMGQSQGVVNACDEAFRRYGTVESLDLRREVAFALELKAMSLNRMGRGREALETCEILVRDFGGIAGQRGISVRWRAMGHQIHALVVEEEESAASRLFREMCDTLDVADGEMVGKIVWDTIDLMAAGATPAVFAEALEDGAEECKLLVPLLAALRELAGVEMRVPEDVSEAAQAIVRAIEARMDSQGRP